MFPGIMYKVFTMKRVPKNGKPLLPAKRKPVDQEMLGSEARLKSIFRAAPVGIGLVINRVIMEANDLLCRMTGYSKEELIGQSARLLYPSDEDFDFVGTEKYRQIANRGTGSVETRWRRKDGTVIDVLLSSGALDPSDLSIGVTFTALDITDRKRMESALRSSHEQTRIAQAAANAGLWDWDMQTGKLEWSEQFFSLIGLSPAAEPSFDTWLKVVHPEDREPAMKKIQKAIDEHIRLENEYRITRSDGEERWLAALGDTFYSDTGKPERMIGICIDITERKRIEEELRTSRDEFEAQVLERTAELRHRAELLDLAHDAIIVTDMEGRIIFWNRGAEKIYGWTPDEVEGSVIYELLKTRSLPSFNDLNSILLDQNTWEGELEHTTKDGRTLSILSRWVFQRDEAGNPIAIMRINLDITAAKQAEESLRQAHKMEAIGTLAGGIAHDFNNILAAIIGFTEMAIEDVPDRPLVERNLQNVMTSATRARELVKQILAFSRKTGYERSPIALTPVVEETVKLLRASVPATIDMKFSAGATSDTVTATPVEVQQIVMNLATNAVLALEDRKGSLVIALSDTDFEPDAFTLDQASREYLQIMVKDTGAGMTPEVMKRIFEPFFTTREVGKGSGMGLAVVYGIVNDLGGTIAVESEPGKGSTFRAFLPKVKAKAKEQVERVELPRGNERVLFVDDEPLLVDWGKETLERLGYKVTTATDSTKALQTFSADPSRFDLVITDQAMPRMAGSDLCAKLLRIRGDIPIILCTGHSETVSPEKAREMGIREFLMKPLRRNELASAIRRVLGGDGG